MSIALERSNSGGDHRIEGSGFGRRSMNFVSPVYSSQNFSAADRGLEEVEQDRSDSLSSSSTSSIGKNSDEDLSGGGDGEGEEVQSEYKKGPLDGLETLEEVLPAKTSISRFYSGKSKSFTSLSDVASLSNVKEVEKPENAYSRRRRNLLAHKYLFDKNFSNVLRSNSWGISKRSANSRSSLALAANMSSNSSASSSNSSSPNRSLPPLPPHARKPTNGESLSSSPTENFTSFRSFSLSDLQVAAAAASPSTTGLLVNKSDK